MSRSKPAVVVLSPPPWLKAFRLVFAVIFPLGAVVGGTFGLVHGLHERSLLQPVPGWTVTAGTVANIDENCYRSCTYGAIVDFTDSKGMSHEFEAPPRSSYPSVGSPVRINYNPQDPKQAHDLSVDGSNWTVEIATMIFLISIGSLFIIATGVIWRRRRRRDRTRPSDTDDDLHTPEAVVGSAVVEPLTTSNLRPVPLFVPVHGRIVGPGLDDDATSDIRRTRWSGIAWLVAAIALATGAIVVGLQPYVYETQHRHDVFVTYLAAPALAIGWAGVVMIARSVAQYRTLVNATWTRFPCSTVQALEGNGRRMLLCIPGPSGGDSHLLTMKSMTRWRSARSGIRQATEIDVVGDPAEKILARVPGHSVLLAFKPPPNDAAAQRWRPAFPASTAGSTQAKSSQDGVSKP